MGDLRTPGVHASHANSAQVKYTSRKRGSVLDRFQTLNWNSTRASWRLTRASWEKERTEKYTYWELNLDPIHFNPKTMTFQKLHILFFFFCHCIFISPCASSLLCFWWHIFLSVPVGCYRFLSVLHFLSGSIPLCPSLPPWFISSSFFFFFF